MCFIENQQLWYENVLSYRTRISEGALPELISFVRENIDAMDLSITGDIVFSISERVTDNDQSIIGMEFIIPVDKRFKSNSRYVFKPKFKLENAVMYKYSGDIRQLFNEKNKLFEYVLRNDLKAVTGVYYCVKKLDGCSGIICMYVGISGNML
ncbi:MAG: hypothetical protein NC395_11665 [Prevotella sp.]|nr:hypothetical protein [Prevotella sp.]